MIDIFTTVLTHGLIAIAALRLLWRDDFDDDELAAPNEREDG